MYGNSRCLCLARQALWQSIGDAEEDEVVNEEQQTPRLARERDRELSSGEVSGLTHQEVMEAARRALR